MSYFFVQEVLLSTFTLSFKIRIPSSAFIHAKNGILVIYKPRVSVFVNFKNTTSRRIENDPCIDFFVKQTIYQYFGMSELGK